MPPNIIPIDYNLDVLVFNSDLKKKSINDFNNAKKSLQEEAIEVRGLSERIYNLRLNCAHEIYPECENYLSTMINIPSDINKSMDEFKLQINVFLALIERYSQDLKTQDIEVIDHAKGAGVGVAAGGAIAGVGVAAFGPAAAMAIATTFGTAGTGAAIASLSGGAAMTAGLAWLGGGAIAAGGGGMAAGYSLLGLAGPIGWGIAGVAAVGGGWIASKKNKKTAEETNIKTEEITVLLKSFKNNGKDITKAIYITEEHTKTVKLNLKKLKESNLTDYEKFTDNQKNEIGILINSVNMLTENINKKIG